MWNRYVAWCPGVFEVDALSHEEQSVLIDAVVTQHWQMAEQNQDLAEQIRLARNKAIGLPEKFVDPYWYMYVKL